MRVQEPDTKVISKPSTSRHRRNSPNSYKETIMIPSHKSKSLYFQEGQNTRTHTLIAIETERKRKETEKETERDGLEGGGGGGGDGETSNSEWNEQNSE